MKQLLILIAIVVICFISTSYFSPSSKGGNGGMSSKLDTEYENMMEQLSSTMTTMYGDKGAQQYNEMEEFLSDAMEKIK